MPDHTADFQPLSAHLRGAFAAVGDRRADTLDAVIAAQPELPLPASGRTLDRWRALAAVAAQDMSLVKLYEAHTDVLATLAELGRPEVAEPQSTWGLWAAEAPGARVTAEHLGGDGLRLSGRKAWCSGAAVLSHALLTTWGPDGSGPFLAAVALRQPGVRVTQDGWNAVGMAACGSVDVVFDSAQARRVGAERAYLERPGFWHGGCGIAACWHGGATALADALRGAASNGRADAHRLAALGAVDVALQRSAALLRQAARLIDDHPRAEARLLALRVRAAADDAAAEVLRHVGRALGAAPFCRDPHFARLAADLPVFVRQTHGDADLHTLGAALAADATEAGWRL